MQLVKAGQAFYKQDMTKRTSPLFGNDKICAAALGIAATKGWAGVTFDSVSKSAKIPATKIKARFAAVNDMAALIVTETGRAALAKASPAGSEHDVFFDLLMSRFEVLQKNRKGVLNIAEAARRDGGLSKALASASLQSAYEFVDASGIKSSPRTILAFELCAVYGWAFLVWKKDASRDMAKTMAALDRALRIAEKAANLLKRSF